MANMLTGIMTHEDAAPHVGLENALPLSDSDPQRTAKEPKMNKSATRKKKNQIANRARHRLRSIHRDATSLAKMLRKDLAAKISPAAEDWPVIPNERCGTWYISPALQGTSSDAHVGTCCYFKSTDGHRDTWNFSFKRLNLQLLDVLAQHGGCVVVDSSVRKPLPDSFTFTIPIWACVLNRIAVRYRSNLLDGGMATPHFWDTQLYTPHSLVDPKERETISALLDQHVDDLYQSKAIVNPKHLLECLTKPIRPSWITNGGTEWLEPSLDDNTRGNYLWLVCANPSTYDFSPIGKIQTVWIDDEQAENAEGYYHVSGAADDHESWARHLTPAFFWKHEAELMDPALSDDQVDQLVDTIVSNAKALSNWNQEDPNYHHHEDYMDQIGNLSLWIGSRRAGRPPECWDHFDAILNVTDQEYEGMTETANFSAVNSARFYLQLPVAEGKRDRTELERWMPVGLLFLIQHLQHGKRILVHCNQGKDRSVAMVLAFVILACPLTFPLALDQGFGAWKLEIAEDSCSEQGQFYKHSGLQSAAVESLLSKGGKEQFLNWIHAQKGAPSTESMADKERLRIALHLIRQDRSVSDPTRSTMQKINRFFMSSSMYRVQDQPT